MDAAVAFGFNRKIQGDTMTLEQAASLGEAISSVAILVSLVFVVIQLRQSEVLNRAEARHSLSLFAYELSKFQAEHADRFAKVHSTEELSDGDRHFRYWGHMQLLLHAETYFRHFQLGLMPPNDWNGYVRFIRAYVPTPGFRECWADVAQGYSEDFSAWMNEQVAAAP
jgi:hypothetical protein